MKILTLPIFCLGLALSACGGNMTNISTSTPSISKSDLGLYQAMPITKEHLQGNWQLENSPLVLTFEEGGVFVLNGCNNISANYQITDYRLAIGSPISTRMLCEGHLMDIDNLATQLLGGEIVLEKFVDALPESAYMKIKANGQEYRLNKIK